MLATAKGWRHGPGIGSNALGTNTGFDSRPCIRTAKRAAAARPKIKDAVCAVQLTPGRNQVGMLKDPRSDASASRNILRIFRNLDSRPRNRAGRVPRSVGHAHTMVHVTGRLGVDPPAGPAQLGSKSITPEDLIALDTWIKQQPDKPSRPEALRRLAKIALAKPK
jgi:hypothetical protein